MGRPGHLGIKEAEVGIKYMYFWYIYEIGSFGRAAPEENFLALPVCFIEIHAPRNPHPPHFT